MIVVIGPLAYRATDTEPIADGFAARIALTAAGLGRSVQLVGKTGEDAEGDAILLALTRGGVGHVAVLRDAGVSTPRAPDGADLEEDGLVADGDPQRDANEPRAADLATEGGQLDAADIELALRYLTEFAVVVLATPVSPAIARVVAEAAGWATARLIVILPAGHAPPDGLPPDAIVFEAPDADPDGVFAETVGSFSAALDEGDDAASAFQATVEASGWAPSPTE